MLNMANKLYNQMKLFNRVKANPENQAGDATPDLEQGIVAPARGPAGAPDCKFEAPLQQVVIDSPRDMPRPPKPRALARAPQPQPRCPQAVRDFEEV